MLPPPLPPTVNKNAATDRYACHPCVNTASVALSLRDLLEKVIPATGHTFTWVTLSAETEQVNLKI